MVNRNIIYLIFIVFIFLCMIFFSIKENFAATTIEKIIQVIQKIIIY